MKSLVDAANSGFQHLFRSAVLLCTAAVLAGCATKTTSAGKSWTTLFDGGSTAAFRGFHTAEFPADPWKVQDGALVSVAGPGTDLITRDKFEDFVLELDWKVTKGANSGILYGVSEETSETYWSGPEFQLNDDPNHDDGKTPKHSAGSLYDLIPPNTDKHLNPTGEWNSIRIESRTGHMEHWLNGKKILEYGWNDPTTRDLAHRSKFGDKPLFMKDRNGHIALQHHGAEVWFRNIRIQRL